MTPAIVPTLDDALCERLAPTLDEIPGSGESGVLQRWAQAPTPTPSPAPGLRFALYGRVSTEDFQDPDTSKGWQLQRAQALIAGRGRITAEFFDTGHSRVLPWPRRPQAAALLAALADPARDFDAIVVGSSERAFYGSQFATTAPLFEHHDVALWLPELGGVVDPALSGHEELMILLGVLSKREIARARIRAYTAMTVQARDQGRYLGGRPPYGYRLADAGPHPNRAWARRGARAQRLETDPATAPVVSWIFAQRRGGKSIARITRALNDAQIPCPSDADPTRNPHRSGHRWALTAVSTILANPRYTGHQVWNRTRTDHVLIDPDNIALGHRDQPHRNPPENWIISTTVAHPALVSPADFIAVQHQRTPTNAPGHSYLLTGLLRCAACGRRMEAIWANHRPSYRCRHGTTSATGPRPNRPRTAYVREDRILSHLPALLLRLPPPHHPLTPTPRAADAAAQLRETGITLVYDRGEQTLTTDTPNQERIFIG